MPAGNVVYFYVREEEKNPAVFKRKEGKKRMGSKNNGAHTESLVSLPSAMFGASDPPTAAVCVLPPLQRRLPQPNSRV